MRKNSRTLKTSPNVISLLCARCRFLEVVGTNATFPVILRAILVVESPDRVSRQRFSDSYPTYQRTLNAGIEIHFAALSVRDLLIPEHSCTDIFRVGVEIDRANAESVLKSERVGAAWTKKRKQASGHERRVPLWLKAVKGNPIEVIPERAAMA
jgi:DNA invertase Pin-like site-specific DNA recombinase